MHILELCLAGTDTTTTSDTIRHCGFYHWVRLFGDLAWSHRRLKVGDFAFVEARLQGASGGGNPGVEIVASRLEALEPRGVIEDAGGWQRAASGVNACTLPGVLLHPKNRETERGQVVSHATLQHQPAQRTPFVIGIIAWDHPEFAELPHATPVILTGRLVNDAVGRSNTRILRLEMLEFAIRRIGEGVAVRTQKTTRSQQPDQDMDSPPDEGIECEAERLPVDAPAPRQRRSWLSRLTASRGSP
jgi:hypothetical protein